MISDPKDKIDSRELAIAAAKIAMERRSSNVVLLDLRGKSPATDYYLIATGTSSRQNRTVADEISKLLKTGDREIFGRAGYEQAKWILLDFVDIVVHLMDAEYREYYDLELIWGNAERVPVPYLDQLIDKCD